MAITPSQRLRTLMKIFPEEITLQRSTRKTYRTGSNGSEKQSRRSASGSMQLENMATKLSALTTTLLSSDIQAVDMECHATLQPASRAVQVVISFKTLGDLEASYSALLKLNLLNTSVAM